MVNLMEESETNYDDQPFVDYLPNLNALSGVSRPPIYMTRHPIVETNPKDDMGWPGGRVAHNLTTDDDN